MHGVDVMQETLFTMKRLDEFVPKQHPLRAVRALFGQTFVATRVPPQTALVDEAIAYYQTGSRAFKLHALQSPSYPRK